MKFTRKTYLAGVGVGLAIFYLPLLPVAIRNSVGVHLIAEAPFVAAIESARNFNVRDTASTLRLLTLIALLVFIATPMLSKVSRPSYFYAGWLSCVVFLLWSFSLIAEGA
jgi:hypothetical protein